MSLKTRAVHMAPHSIDFRNSNPLTAKLKNLNVHPHEVVGDPQLQVGGNNYVCLI